MAAGVSVRLEARVRSTFDADSVEPVLTRLAELQLPLVESEASRERVQAAVVLLADGQSSAFEREASLAEVDWRDVLVAAGLANEDWRERLDERLGATHAP